MSEIPQEARNNNEQEEGQRKESFFGISSCQIIC